MKPVESQKRLPEKIQHLENQVVESNQEWEFQVFFWLFKKMSFQVSTSKQASKLSREFNWPASKFQPTVFATINKIKIWFFDDSSKMFFLFLSGGQWALFQ